MRHLTITTFGCFIGLESKRLIVREKDKVIGEYPIARLKSVQVTASGVSFSSNLLYELSLRGISFFVIDFRSIPVLVLSGTQHHAVVELRKHQFQFFDSEKVPELCQKIIIGKLKNQRTVLLYFLKSSLFLPFLLQICKESMLKIWKDNFLHKNNLHQIHNKCHLN